MNKEEIKQWLRNQIDSSIKTQSKFYKNRFYLYYNKSHIRALKFSTITGNPVNKEDFNSGEKIFHFNTENKSFRYYPIIRDYLKENYSKRARERLKIVEEVVNEEYKGYTMF